MRERGDLACFHEPFMGDHYVHRAVRTMPLYDVDPSQPAAYEAAEEEETYDEESSGAIGIGVRSGNGQLHRKAGSPRPLAAFYLTTWGIYAIVRNAGVRTLGLGTDSDLGRAKKQSPLA